MDAQFAAECNAAAVVNAELYYRAFFGSRVNTWNLRDRHMRDTLLSLHRYRYWRGGQGRAVIWAHNSHVGDARATELGRSGEFSGGELVRGAWGDDCFLVGFTAYRGRVTAASTWGGQVERKHVRPALQGSFEDQLHHAPSEDFLVRLGEHAPEPLRSTQLERAIGVIYRPETERLSHWFHATISAQFDALVHLDTTSAVHPLDRTPLWDAGEPPETYPTGL